MTPEINQSIRPGGRVSWPVFGFTPILTYRQ